MAMVGIASSLGALVGIDFQCVDGWSDSEDSSVFDIWQPSELCCNAN